MNTKEAKETKVIVTKTKKGRPNIKDGEESVTMSLSVTQREVAEFEAMAEMLEGGNRSKLFRRIWESWKREIGKKIDQV